MIAAPVDHSPGHHSLILVPPFEPLDSRSVTQLSFFIPPTRSHNMTTRSMKNIYKPKKLYLTTKHLIPQLIESSYVSQDLKDHKWRYAMSEEFNALVKHGTWELVPPNPSIIPVSCKWIFRVKHNVDFTI